MRTLRLIAFAVIVGSITAVALVAWKQGSKIFGNPFGPSNGCSATVNGNNVSLDTGQGEYAALIAAIGLQRGLPPRAVSIALATAFQESKIRNLPGGDQDSLGLFQQRPSVKVWGTAAEIMDPVHATNAFYDALVKINGYTSLGIGIAAQDVQHSADTSGDSYQQHATDARTLASALTGYSPAAFSCVVTGDSALGTADGVVASLNQGYGNLINPQHGLNESVTVAVDPSAAGHQLGWSVAQYAVAMAPDLHIKAVLFDHKKWTTGNSSSNGWVSDAAAATSVSILMQ